MISHADFPFISETDPNEKAIELRERAFGPESFHNGDYSLFYNNIKENVKARINSVCSLSGLQEPSAWF